MIIENLDVTSKDLPLTVRVILAMLMYLSAMATHT